MSENGAPEFNKEDFLSLFFSPEVPFNYKFYLVIGVGLYSLTPIDILPEALLGPIGLADDVGIWIAGAQIFMHFANKALERKHNEKHEAEQPMVITAQSAETPAPPADPNAQKVRLPDDHLRRHHNRPAAPEPAPVEQIEVSKDALSDEQHEQLIQQKNTIGDDAFEQMMREAEKRGTGGDWDFSRNDPFNKKRPKPKKESDS